MKKKNVKFDLSLLTLLYSEYGSEWTIWSEKETYVGIPEKIHFTHLIICNLNRNWYSKGQVSSFKSLNFTYEKQFNCHKKLLHGIWNVFNYTVAHKNLEDPEFNVFDVSNVWNYYSPKTFNCLSEAVKPRCLPHNYNFQIREGWSIKLKFKALHLYQISINCKTRNFLLELCYREKS